MRNSFHAVLFAPILVLWASAAQAQGYLGLGLGVSKIPDQPPSSCAEFGLPSSCTLSKKDTDSAFRIFGGFRVTPNFAVEAGYVDLGRSHVDIASPVVATADFKVSGLDISAIGSMPFGSNFGGMARAGLFLWKTIPSVSSGGVTVSDRDTGVSATLGLGLTYDFSRQFGGRLEWQRFFEVGNDVTTGTTNVDFVSINGVFRF
jgi:OmpA-OmpF porin, OOP family